MAYMNQERKNKISPEVTKILKRYGLAGRLSIRNHSTLVLKITRGKIDFISDHIDCCINNYADVANLRINQLKNMNYFSTNLHWLDKYHSGAALACLQELHAAMKGPDYFDHSDIQSDYFHCSHYVDINIGTYEKPYLLEK
jgi:hypothetical protein